MKSKIRKPDLIRLILLCFFVGVFCFSAAKLVTYFWVETESENYYDTLAEKIFVSEEPSVSSPVSESAASDNEQKVANFEALHAENNEICGWLILPDTVLNYPVAKAEDNTKYLHHLPNGKYSYGGTLFMDFRNSVDFTDSYTLIYGHNMKNKKTMFAPLMNYKKQSFYDSHPMLTLQTGSGNYNLTVFAVVLTDTDSEYYAFPFTDEKRDGLLAAAKKDSLVKTAVEITKADRIVALSTCDYSKDGARFIVLCKAEAEA